MVKFMKKTITYLLIVLIIFNFIFCKYNVYADPDSNAKQQGIDKQGATPNDTVAADIIEGGQASTKQDSGTKATLSLGSAGLSAVGAVTGLLARIVNIFVIQIDIMFGLVTMGEEQTDAQDPKTQFWFSIDRVVFNRVPLFNINYFNTEDTYNIDENTSIVASRDNIALKNGIVKIYSICRILALTLALLVLIYIGIRMAISTISSDKAKYKKMLVSWIESVIIIFILVYIMIVIIQFGEIITGVFYKIRTALVQPRIENHLPETFEETIRTQVLNNAFKLSGLELTMWSIIYWIFLFIELKFFWLYAKRFLMVGFLIMIAPLITITYSIDKVGDGKAQVFSNWMQEFMLNVLIQPLHALIYLIFVVTANEIAIQSPLVALALLLAMGTVEKMVKVVFKMNAITLNNVDKFMNKKG